MAASNDVYACCLQQELFPASFFVSSYYGFLSNYVHIQPVPTEQGVSFCGSNSIRSNCWDGKNQTRSDIDDFKNESISGQGKFVSMVVI